MPHKIGLHTSCFVILFGSFLFWGCPSRPQQPIPTRRVPSNATNKPTPSPFAKQYNFPTRSLLSPVRGPRDAPLQIVELLNPTSPHSRAIQALRAQVWKKFPGMIRWTVRFNPTVQRDKGYWYSRALYASYQAGIFWSFLQRFHKSLQNRTHRGFLRMASNCGVDPQRFELKLLYDPYKMLIDRDMRWARALGQPAHGRLFVNGALLAPPYTKARVMQAIAWARRKAFAMLKRYKSSRQMYSHWVRAGEKLKPLGQPPEAIRKRRYIHVPFGFLEGVPARGPGDAAVSIVEFSDFTCRPCRKAYFSLHKLLQMYPKHLRFYFKYYPIGIHRESYRSAELAAAAQDQRKFWALYNILFREQNQLFRGNLLALARKAGMDARWLSGELDRNSYRRRVRINHGHGKSLRIRAVPTLIIDGRMVFGASSASSLIRVTKQELWKSGVLISPP